MRVCCWVFALRGGGQQRPPEGAAVRMRADRQTHCHRRCLARTWVRTSAMSLHVLQHQAVSGADYQDRTRAAAAAAAAAVVVAGIGVIGVMA